VAAVGGAFFLGVTAPVRAASVVTYTLENAELADGDDVTGSLSFDLANDEITGADFYVENQSGVLDEDTQYDTGAANAFFVESEANQTVSGITLMHDLSGAPGESVQLVTGGSSASEIYDPNSGEDEKFEKGSVSDGSAGPSSVPEPSSILATVTAVTLGVGLRRMKRKV